MVRKYEEEEEINYWEAGNQARDGWSFLSKGPPALIILQAAPAA